MAFEDDFKYILVMDFEANCTSSQQRDHEIIEFPVVVVDIEKAIVLDNEFRRLVKPLSGRPISKFITELCHLTNEQVYGEGKTWDEVLADFDEWLRENEYTATNSFILTCGAWDFKTMWPRQLSLGKTKLKSHVYLLTQRWHNIKKSFSKEFKGKRAGMDGMLKELKLPLVGHHHSGIDDSRNIAAIALALMHRGVRLKPNDFSQEPFWYKRNVAYRRTKNGHIVRIDHGEMDTLEKEKIK